jgi:hypothetical protein
MTGHYDNERRSSAPQILGLVLQLVLRAVLELVLGLCELLCVVVVSIPPALFLISFLIVSAFLLSFPSAGGHIILSTCV